MEMFVISDNADTQIGLRLTGINGIIVHTKEDCKQQLDLVLANPKIAILLITEKLTKLIEEDIKEVKLNRKLPLIVEIPDRHGSVRSPDFITNYVREAIGVKLS